MTSVPRVLLITQPKAGTYLISEMLRRLGLHQTYYHLRLDSLDAYDGRQLDAGRRAPRHWRAEIPIEEAVKLIRTAEFGVGHLPCCERAVAAVDGMRLVAARREQRAALVSCMRFHDQTGRGALPSDVRRDPRRATVDFLRRSGPRLVEHARESLPWGDQEGVLSLRFEDVRAHPAAVAAELARHLGVADDSEGAARGLERADTLTRSSAPTTLDEYWSDEAEAIFADLGGPELNAAAGYREPVGVAAE